MRKTNDNLEKSFEALLEKGDQGLGWTIARVPFEPAKVWPKMLRLRVCGELNGFFFRTSLFPDPRNPGRYFVLVNKTMQGGGQVTIGESASFSLQPDTEERPADLPDELAALLDDAEGLRAWYDGLSEYTRREIGKWIYSVGSEEARVRRATQMAERLLNTMEAEIELPPMLSNAFRLRPKARAGWIGMTATQRRSELLAIFSYRTPDSRQKRVSKLCDTAEGRVK